MRWVLPLTLLGCNDAPLWPDESWGPGGDAPWSHPTDNACENFEAPDPGAFEVDGFQFCGSQSAFGHIVPVDDPIYADCTQVTPGATDPVMSVFDGERARAYQLAALQRREIVHTDWSGADLLVTYCPIIAGGVVFHREIDGESSRFNVAGLWGSANTVAPRHELVSADFTVYTTWDGHALFGPGRPGSIREFGALIDYISAGEFAERYGGLGETCEVWFGQEELGVGCAEACAHRLDVCGETGAEECERLCAAHPRSKSDCMLLADSCDALRRC